MFGAGVEWIMHSTPAPVGGSRVTRRRIVRTLGLGGTLVLAGCTDRGLGGAVGDSRPWDELSLDVQLDRVREATRAYRDVAVAVADGFAEASLVEQCAERFYRQRGWENTESIDPLSPTGLVYAAGEQGTETRRLVAVAYLLPTRTREPGVPPDLFNDEVNENDPVVAGYAEEHIWEAIPDETGVHDGRVWRLLAWVHEPNPFGVFNSYNPNYPLSLGDTDCTG
jgi:hypothetical protein